jgi:hypothetical protein
MWDSSSYGWKDWRYLAQEYGLISFDRPFIMELISLILESRLFKMNIAILGPLWRDRGWSFGCPLFQYDSRHWYSTLHQQHLLSPVLNARWVSIYAKDRWVCHLHIVQTI